MIILTKQNVIELHSYLISETGGDNGIRDNGLLESALNAPFQTYDMVDLFPTIKKKAARLCFGFIKNHPFVDGNKRIGVMAMIVFLNLNNVTVAFSDDDLIDLGLGVAESRYDETYIEEWINKHDK